MLIPFNVCYDMLAEKNMVPKGVLHIGAHECEELKDYMNKDINQNNIVWIDAIQEKVDKMNSRGIPNVYCAALNDTEQTVKFNITNNGQSSSLLDFGTHKTNYPSIRVIESREVQTQTLKNFIEKNNISIEKCNFWNLDIQGKELDVLKSAEEYIKYADAIYCEVNTEEVYQGCGVLVDLDVFLKSKGLQRVKLEMTFAGWGDALYVRIP